MVHGVFHMISLAKLYTVTNEVPRRVKTEIDNIYSLKICSLTKLQYIANVT